MEQDRGLAGSISAPPAHAPTPSRCLCPPRATQAPPPPATPLARPSDPRPAALPLLSSLRARGQGLRPGVTLTDWEMEDPRTERHSADGQSPALRRRRAWGPGWGASRSPVYPGTPPSPPGPFLPRRRGVPRPRRREERRGKEAPRGARPEARTARAWDTDLPVLPLLQMHARHGGRSQQHREAQNHLGNYIISLT